MATRLLMCSAQMERFVHVFRCPLAFNDGREHCLFLCDCRNMCEAWDTLSGMETSAMDYSECFSRLKFCEHSNAIRELHEDCVLPYASRVEQGQGHRLEDLNFACTEQPITILLSSPSLLLSCDFGEGGLSRGVVRTDKKRLYCCCSCNQANYNCKEHIQPLAQWLESRADDASHVGEVFDDFSFKIVTSRATPHDSEFVDHPAISHRRIPLDFFNERMEERVKCSECLNIYSILLQPIEVSLVSQDMVSSHVALPASYITWRIVAIVFRLPRLAHSATAGLRGIKEIRLITGGWSVWTAR